MHVSRTVKNSPDAIRLGGISHQIAAQLEALINIECRVTILGHLVRGGSPTAHDRLLAMRFGIEAAHLAARGKSGVMVSLRGSDITSVPLSEVAGKQRKVTPDHPWVKAAISRISSAITENPTPVDPEWLASMAALIARKLVCSEMSRIDSTDFKTRSDDF